jgi:hypothetical protein
VFQNGIGLSIADEASDPQLFIKLTTARDRSISEVVETTISSDTPSYHLPLKSHRLLPVTQASSSLLIAV